MIKKIILFGDFKTVEAMALKSAAVQRLGYALSQKSYDVKQVHHCTSFSYDDLKKIVTNFSNGEPVCVCVSTSFIAGVDRKNVKFQKSMTERIGKAWGASTFLFLLNIGKVCKEFGFPYLLGGWEITKENISKNREAWSYHILAHYVTYFIEGKDTEVIEDVCNDKPIQYESFDNKKFVISNGVVDFSDCASTMPTDAVLNENESICTEVAAGCIFSCSFCNYASLGKKKNEFTRSYDSFEREVIENYSNHKTTFYTLTDNIVNDTTEKIRYLIDVRNKTGIDFRWTGYARLDTIQTKEQARMLKESGMVGANFGIESLYKASGPYIGKVTDKTRILKSLEIVRGVFEDEAILTGLFIAGLPEEPLDHMVETYEWLNSIEGRYFIDHYAYTAFVLYTHNDSKNDINKARKNPFKDYQKISALNWTSPWATFDEVLDLARKFTVERKNSMGGAFSLPYLVNIGYDLNTLIKDIRECGRQGMPFNVQHRKQTQNFLEEYKRKTLMPL
jgi:radical SAM superfamily enzyme YgiQ (UPF0313 family)